jgi:hypothetical protein
MAGVQLDTTHTTRIAGIPAHAVDLNTLPSKEKGLIERTHKAGQMIGQTMRPSVRDKMNRSVTFEEHLPIARTPQDIDRAMERDPFETLEALKQQHQKELKIAKLNGDRKRVNYLTQISELIAKLSTLLNDWTSRDNGRIHEKKTQYRKASATLEENHVSKGLWNMGFGFCSVAIGLMGPQGLEGAFNHFTTSFNNYLTAYDTKPSQDNQLTLQELQKLNDTSQSNNSTLEEAKRIKEAIAEWYRSAVR